MMKRTALSFAILVVVSLVIAFAGLNWNLGKPHKYGDFRESASSRENATGKVRLSSDHYSTTPEDKDTSNKSLTLSSEVIENVKIFLFFAGYQRSGHSIIGSILDAHPHMIVSHELQFLRRWNAMFTKKYSKYPPHKKRTDLYNKIYQNSATAALSGKSREHDRKGYTLAIQPSWQGKFDDYVQVIGDKCGGGITQEYLKSHTEFVAHLQELKEIVSVPIKVIHVIRNPYDIITTNALYEIGKLKDKRNAAPFVKKVKQNERVVWPKVSISAMIRECIINFFDRAQAVVNISELVGPSNMLTVHHTDLVYHPQQTILFITNFLGVAAEKKYLKICADKVFSEEYHSRHLLKWTDKLKAQVQDQISKFDFCKNYKF